MSRRNEKRESSLAEKDLGPCLRDRGRSRLVHQELMDVGLSGRQYMATHGNTTISHKRASVSHRVQNVADSPPFHAEDLNISSRLEHFAEDVLMSS